jgi:hypothetical protein
MKMEAIPFSETAVIRLLSNNAWQCFEILRKRKAQYVLGELDVVGRIILSIIDFFIICDVTLKWLELLLRTPEVPASNVGPGTVYL